MGWVVGAMFVFCGTVGMSLLPLRRVMRLFRLDLGQLTAALRKEERTALAGRLRKLGGWELDLLEDVASAPLGTDAARLLLNQHLGELDRNLNWGAHFSRSALRLVCAGTLLLIFIGVLRGGLTYLTLADVGLWGLASALTVASATRATDEVVRGLRADMDRFARVLATSVQGSPLGSPAPLRVPFEVALTSFALPPTFARGNEIT